MIQLILINDSEMKMKQILVNSESIELIGSILIHLEKNPSSHLVLSDFKSVYIDENERVRLSVESNEIEIDIK